MPRPASALLVLLLLAAACSTPRSPATRPGRRPPPPATPTTEPAVPPSAGERVTPPPAAPGATLPPGQWPDACTLLTDAELLALVPDETAVSRHGQPGEEPSGGETSQPTTCEYDLARPGTPSGYPPDDIVVDVRAVGDHAVLARAFADARRTAATQPGFADYGTSLRTDGSFWDGTEIENLIGGYEIWISGHQNRADQDPATDDLDWRSRVLVRTVTILAPTLE